MTGILWLKMVRDMRKSLATYGLCVLIVAIGFCGYSVLELCYRNLMESRDLFFRQSFFCDGFADVVQAPRAQSRLLMEIDGVASAEGRLVKDVQVSGIGENAELHLVSWSEGGMNRPVLSRGEQARAGAREIVIGEGFANARGLKPGDSINLVIAGKQIPMEITGLGLTPENIYMVKDMSDMFPDHAAYDAGFLSYETMAQLLSLSGQANGFLFELEPWASWDAVKDPIEQMLKPYGLSSLYEKDDHMAVSMVNEEMKQLTRMSAVVPFLFLAVAGVILYITLSRLAEQQRTQVGTFMAMGIPIKKIQLHFMAYGGLTGLLGGLLGGILGYLLADPLASYYRTYFKLPEATAPISYQFLFGGTAAAAVFCAGTSWLIAGGLGSLTPAAALRPPTPKTVRESWLEHIPGFTSLFTVPGLMALRSLARNRRRTVLSLCGMAFAYMITASLVSMYSLFDVFIFDYWEETQRQDIMVTFGEPVPAGDAMEAVRNPQVQTAEGVLEFPVTLRGPVGKVECTVQAISQDSTLCRLYTADGGQVYTEGEGIVLSEHMAALMGVSRGDLVEVRISYPEEKSTRVPVTSVVAQYMGSAAYMSYEGAAKVSEYRGVYNSMLLKAPESALLEIMDRLEDAPAVAGVESRKDRLDQYRSMMGNMNAIMASMSMMGVIIGFSVVYISSLISFEELKREVSTLMMLGLKSKQCLDVISTGQWILTAGAILLGIPMTMGVSRLISVTMASELFTIPNFVDGTSLVQAIGLTALSVLFSSMMMLRKLKKISPVELLMDREG